MVLLSFNSKLRSIKSVNGVRAESSSLRANDANSTDFQLRRESITTQRTAQPTRRHSRSERAVLDRLLRKSEAQEAVVAMHWLHAIPWKRTF